MQTSQRESNPDVNTFIPGDYTDVDKPGICPVAMTRLIQNRLATAMWSRFRIEGAGGAH